MPVSKDGNLYFTDEQRASAFESSALEYAQVAGYDLVRDGASYRLRAHDSMVFRPDGSWHWYSRDLHGGSILFIQAYEHRTYVEAILILAGELDRRTLAPIHAPPPLQRPPKILPEQKPFVLPPRASDSKRLFAYLCGVRKLSNQIVRDLLRCKRLYQGTYTAADSVSGQTRTFHNAVFVGFDEAGAPKSAFQRGLTSFASKPFKRDVAGSDKSYPFTLPCHEHVDAVAVFEGAIDAISHATIAENNAEDYRRIARIALGGVSVPPLRRILTSHPTIRQIVLCLDIDAAGEAAVQRFQETFAEYHISIAPPEAGKDWNDTLVAQHQRSTS